MAPLLDLTGISVAADIVTVALTAVFALPYCGIIASAYLQLRDERDPPNRTTSDPIDVSQTTDV